ncbi:MAG: S-adenosylmethionine-dependent methyltransferase [Candidatus Parcubacteria bacterium]|nr:MAG: S-adenosylmethionine-dependent methyltransferase [Candidatus Parcubacteria bacterium]
MSQTQEQYFDRLAYIYDSFLFRLYFQPLYNKIINLLTKEVIKHINYNFLDVGCGTGEVLYNLAKNNPQAYFYGVDISEKMLAKAQDKLKEFPNVKLIKGDIENIVFKNDRFDYILVSEAFHHLYNPEKIINKFYQLLNKDGKLIIVDPTIDTKFSKIILSLATKFEVLYKIYSNEELKNLLLQNNFVIEKNFKYFLNSFIVASVVAHNS